MDKIYAVNIQMVMQMYDPENVVTRQDFLCFLIAHRFIIPDMKSGMLNFPAMEEYFLGTNAKINNYIKKVRDGMNLQFLLEDKQDD